MPQNPMAATISAESVSLEAAAIIVDQALAKGRELRRRTAPA